MAHGQRARAYASLSRYTDPGAHVAMLRDLPSDVEAICAIAARQTIHHNLRASLGVRTVSATRVWPPSLGSILEALAATGPRRLSLSRRPEDRVLGACALESHFLAGLLRYQGHEVRVRAGYFRGIREEADHVVAFWNAVNRWNGREPIDDYTRKQNAIDHRIEHFVCELFEDGRWVILDANTDFLRFHSRLAVDARLPRKHFEYAHDAWRALHDPNVPKARYAEDPHSGEAHVRRQMLQDFFALLNHDLAAVDELHPEEDTYAEMADVLATEPDIDALVRFYRTHSDVHLPRAEADGHAFVAQGRDPREAVALRAEPP